MDDHGVHEEGRYEHSYVLWGKVKGKQTWHALARHDPDYPEEYAVSEKLGTEYRKALPGEPGTGVTYCGMRDVPLSTIGCDPEKDDKLCESCESIIKPQ